LTQAGGGGGAGLPRPAAVGTWPEEGSACVAADHSFAQSVAATYFEGEARVGYGGWGRVTVSEAGQAGEPGRALFRWDVNECATENGGCGTGLCDRCTNSPGGFECAHFPQACQANRSHAESCDPCLNGGSCVDLGERWLCACPPRFSGVLCEQPVAADSSSGGGGGTGRSGADMAEPSKLVLAGGFLAMLLFL
jgi:hypothetical protein